MGNINWVSISSIIVDLVILSILISCTYWGHRKGLTSVIFKILTFIISIIIVFILYKPVANFVMEKTQIDEWLNVRIAETLNGTKVADGELIKEEETNLSKTVVQVINSLVKESINNAKESAVTYVAGRLSCFMISVLTMIFLLIITKILLGFIKGVAELIAKLPIIRILDKSGGLVYGFIKGIIIIYLILAVLSILSPLISDSRILNAINDSNIGSRLYNNNILLKLVIK
ncbi:MAG: CvpA family protein [Candidatus Scatovivens sp.]